MSSQKRHNFTLTLFVIFITVTPNFARIPSTSFLGSQEKIDETYSILKKVISPYKKKEFTKNK